MKSTARLILALVFASSIVASASGQGAQSSTPPNRRLYYDPSLPDFNTVEMKTTKIRDNVYVIEGGPGADVITLVGHDGVLLVDAQYPPLTNKIVQVVGAITSAPIRYLIDTHVHPDHVGGNENFAKLGVTILGADRVRDRLLEGVPDALGFRPPVGPIAAPAITYSGPVTIHFDGEDVELLPIPHAHTDGDTLVRFPVADLIMMGDLYWNERGHGYLAGDPTIGGSMKGLIDGLGVAINLAGPKTMIIPAHGTPTDRAALMASRDMLIEIRRRVLRQIQNGKSEEEILAAGITTDYDAQVPNGERSSKRLLRQMYEDLRGPQ